MDTISPFCFFRRFTAILSIGLFAILGGAEPRAQTETPPRPPAVADTIPTPIPRSRIVEKLVAWVNAEPVALSEVKEALSRFVSEGEMEPGAMSEARLRRALELLIDETLIVEAAKKAGIKVSAESVDNRLDEMFEKLEKSQGGRKQLEEMLEQQGLSRKKMRKTLRRQVERELLIGQAIAAQISLSLEDVKEFEAERRSKDQPTVHQYASHLFIPVPARAPEEKWDQAFAKARAFRAKAMQEGNFARAAAEFARLHASEGVAGGPLGMVDPEKLEPELAAQFPHLAVGGSGEPVRTSRGVHVLYLDRITTARQILFSLRFKEKKAKWSKELRRAAAIQTAKTLLGEEDE